MIVYQSDIFNKLSVGGIDLDFKLIPCPTFKLNIMIFKDGDHFVFDFEYLISSLSVGLILSTFLIWFE